MDFAFSVQQERFKREVRDFFIDNQRIVAEARNERSSGWSFGPYCCELLGKVGCQGWLCPTCPSEYGRLELLDEEALHESENRFKNLAVQ